MGGVGSRWDQLRDPQGKALSKSVGKVRSTGGLSFVGTRSRPGCPSTEGPVSKTNPVYQPLAVRHTEGEGLQEMNPGQTRSTLPGGIRGKGVAPGEQFGRLGRGMRPGGHLVRQRGNPCGFNPVVRRRVLEDSVFWKRQAGNGAAAAVCDGGVGAHWGAGAAAVGSHWTGGRGW